MSVHPESVCSCVFPDGHGDTCYVFFLVAYMLTDARMPLYFSEAYAKFTHINELLHGTMSVAPIDVRFSEVVRRALPFCVPEI